MNLSPCQLAANVFRFGSGEFLNRLKPARDDKKRTCTARLKSCPFKAAREASAFVRRGEVVP